MRGIRFCSVVLAGVAAFGAAACGNTKPSSPKADESAFVSVAEIDPTIVVDARYFGEHNFIGGRINGYEAPKCLLTKEAATALADVQRELRPMGLGLKTYDCYRPQRAVDQFVSWAKDLGDTTMRAEFYPTVEKANLFRDGYIAEKSGHSRGSTLDLTIVALPAPDQEQYHSGDPLRACTLPADQRFRDNSLDLGTGYDCFDPLAHTADPAPSSTQRALRELLVNLMDEHGFKNLAEEWWHFTLKNEPFPNTYFDFPIQ